MKKLLAVLLAVTTVFCTTTMTTYADELTKVNTKTDFDSTIETTGSNPWVDTNWNDTNTTVCVNVKWSDTNFTYTFGDKWSAQDHKYVHSDDSDKEDGWDLNFIKIDVENLSNCPVLVEITDIETLDEDVKIQFDKNRKTKNLTSALRAVNVEKKRNQYQFIMNFEYTPKEYVEDIENADNLINFKVKISEGTSSEECDHVFVPSNVSYVEDPDFVGDSEYINTDHPIAKCYFHECSECGLVEKHNFTSDHIKVFDGRYVNYHYYCKDCKEYIDHSCCYDVDEDGLCNLCGLERDFCADCHLGTNNLHLCT